MPSPFQKYQSEQVQQIAPGFVEAYGRAGAAIGQGLAQAGQAVVQGYEEAKKKSEEEAIQKGSLDPFLQRDKAKIEAGVKSGSLIKNPDGTVSVNPNNPNKDMLDTSAIDFYNKTGGDINKLTGVDLKRFIANFESKKKIEAQEREAATSQVELDLKRAQTLKLTTEARLAEAEAGNLNTIYNAAGFGNAAPGITGSTIPTVPGSPVAPGAVARPSLAAYTGTGTSFDSNGLPQGGAFFESLARFDATLKRGSEPAPTTSAPAAPAPTSADFDKYGYPKQKPTAAAPEAAAAPAVSPALTAGTKPAAAPTGAQTQAAAPAPAPAAAPAAAPATQAAVPERVEIERVRETAEVVQARINTLGTERTRLVQRMQEDIGNAQRDHAAIKARMIVTKGTGTAANMLISYQESAIKDIENRYKAQIDAVDNQVKAEQGKLDIAKTVAASSASNRAETARDIKANLEETDRKRADVAAYPRIGPFVHIGSEIIRKGKEPSKYGIRALTATAQNEVNTLAEGWIKSTDFILGMAETLEQRDALDQDYTGRMRLLTKDLENWATGELQQVFGVATFRRAIVSGGNFSDSDRLFVQRAITYINTLDPIDDKEVFEASTNALAKFVDNMYRKSMLGYDMKFSPSGLEEQAQALEDDGFKDQADQQRAVADASRRFMEKFGIEDSGNKLSFDAAAVEEARATLWTTLQNAGQLGDANKEVKDGDVVFRLRDSAPRSK
jgi:hypothetical protein